MTVPFRPGGVDPGPDFLSTLTRSFMQARGLVESDTQRRRAKERFASEQESARLRNEMLQQELEIRGAAETRAQRAADIQEARPSDVVTREELPQAEFQSPFPEAEMPAGAGISGQLAAALAPPGGLQERPQAGPASEVLPEGFKPVEGQPGLFLDINFEQRESERTRAEEATYVAEQIEAAAIAAEQRGDLEEAQRLRDATPRAVLDVHQGRQPDTAALLEARERRATPTFLQSERLQQEELERQREDRQEFEDRAIETQLQQSAHRELQELGDPAGTGHFVPGRDYEKQLENARATGRRRETAAGRPPLSLRQAIDVLKDDPAVWSPDTGYKIPLNQVMQKAGELVQTARETAGASGVDSRIPVTQLEYDGIVEDSGEEYAAANFVVGG